MAKKRLVFAWASDWTMWLVGFDVDANQVYSGDEGLMRGVEVSLHLPCLRLSWTVEWLAKPYSGRSCLDTLMEWEAEHAR